MSVPAETPLNVLLVVASGAGFCLCLLAGEAGVWLWQRLRHGKKGKSA